MPRRLRCPGTTARNFHHHLNDRIVEVDDTPVLTFRKSGLSRVALARRFDVDDQVIRRMLNPRHGTATTRIHNVLPVLGCELVVESRAI